MTEISFLTKELPQSILDGIYRTLKKVYPKHIDQFAFFKDREHLMTVFPGVEQWTGYTDEEEDMPWLRKSRFTVRRKFNLSEINRMKVYSEEVSIDEEITILSDSNRRDE